MVPMTDADVEATAAITRMIEALQEQLVTIDELRARMPDPRARESNLRGQLDALEAQLADRDAYLKLADDLEGFLAQLRENAGTAEVPERQRVLRLLVKDVLVGPDKIIIRHRIPVRERWPCRKPHPAWSRSMLVLVKEAAESVGSMYVEAGVFVRIGDR
ncbi:hypothetical protein OG806_08605 [Streptomyces sp. NBC_00882]|uniref:hypothetical protein n=1 Tax=Streptomyces TaxID=1883 RepID=UPI00386D7E5D|nr:hypothetical protein OH837_40460 [Streptomyces canus]WSZ29484.1 hypothetical protein OG806_08605 [Streptomyces sp. NBC_00882]WSZ63653.1 hypothetical protein OH824_47605 [Streptomyces canus]